MNGTELLFHRLKSRGGYAGKIIVFAGILSLRCRYGSLGRPVAELAEKLCISANLLYSLKSSSQAAQGGCEGENAAADALRGLRREIALLRQENDIFLKSRSHPRHQNPAELRAMTESIHQQTGHGIWPNCQVLRVPRSSYYHASEPTPCQSADGMNRGHR